MRSTDEPTKESIAKARQWKATVDKNTGKTFYYHQLTKEAQWKKPPGFDEVQKEQNEREAEKADSTFLDAICYENSVVNRSSSSTTDGETEGNVRDAANPTTLFQHLQQKHWTAASRQVQKKPQESKIWISNELGGTRISQSSSWKVLPLHTSIILGAPSSLIIQILDCYPDAARKKDLNGSLPMHLAACSLCSYVNGEQVFEALLSAYPEARNIEDRNGHTPFIILHYTQIAKDQNTKKNSRRMLDIIATETAKEGIVAQLETLPGNEIETSATSSDSTAYIPDALEFITRRADLSSSLGNPSSLWSESSGSSSRVSGSKEGCSLKSESIPEESEGDRCTVTDEDEDTYSIATEVRDSADTTASTLASFDKPAQSQNQTSLKADEQANIPQRQLPSNSSLDAFDSASTKAKLFFKSKAWTISYRLRKSKSHNDCSPHMNNVDELYDCMTTVQTFPPHSSPPIPTIDEVLHFSAENREQLVEGRGMDCEQHCASKERGQAPDALKSQPTFAKSRPEDLLGDSIMHSNSHNGCPPHTKATDESYDCMLTAKTFPPYSIRTTPTKIDDLLVIGTGEQLVEEGWANSVDYADSPSQGKSTSHYETADEARKWAKALDGMTKKTYYYHRETKEIRWVAPSVFADILNNEDNSETVADSSNSFKDVESPTILYLHLHRSDWPNVLVRLSEYPAEASVWIWRKSRGCFLWRLLPLHASIVLGAPSYLILEILTTYPEAARERDLNGSLPIHLAAARVNSHEDGEKIINHLMRAFPDSILIPDGRGLTAMDIVEGNGRTIESTSGRFPIELEDDVMLRYGTSNSTTKSLDIFTKSEAESNEMGSFAMESGYTAFSSFEGPGCCSIEDDFEHMKSGFIRITFND